MNRHKYLLQLTERRVSGRALSLSLSLSIRAAGRILSVSTANIFQLDVIAGYLR